ncbi:MCE family protein [Mycobacteroides abscessus]|uniref:MCE family protein n=1 Tax=Mycobacteroides abscessus TaxID=36809 RepID=UPI002103A223|nr:MlaD family protein [Mycobacteroides abscessus]
MNLKKRARRRLVAYVAIGVVLTCSIVLLSIRTTHHPRTLTALFEDSLGLYEGNAVSVLGIKIGKVGKITTKDEHVEVILKIDNPIDIPDDVQAVTVSTSVLTDRHVELTPPYHGGPTIADGDVIPMHRTRTPVEFDRTIAMVDKLARALRGNAPGEGPVADLLNISTQITSSNGSDIMSTLDELAKALRLSSDYGARSKEAVENIISNLAELARSASENETVIRQFGSNLRTLSQILADEHLGAGNTGARFNQILEQAVRILERHRGDLSGTITDTRTLTKAVTDYQRELAEALDLAPLVADNVYNAVDTNAGVMRGHVLVDKVLFDSQLTKEFCNLLGLRQLGCSSGTLADYGPDFGLTSMLDLMAQTS